MTGHTAPGSSPSSPAHSHLSGQPKPPFQNPSSTPPTGQRLVCWITKLNAISVACMPTDKCCMIFFKFTHAVKQTGSGNLQFYIVCCTTNGIRGREQRAATLAPRFPLCHRLSSHVAHARNLQFKRKQEKSSFWCYTSSIRALTSPTKCNIYL